MEKLKIVNTEELEVGDTVMYTNIGFLEERKEKSFIWDKGFFYISGEKMTPFLASLMSVRPMYELEDYIIEQKEVMLTRMVLTEKTRKWKA